MPEKHDPFIGGSRLASYTFQVMRAFLLVFSVALDIIIIARISASLPRFLSPLLPLLRVSPHPFYRRARSETTRSAQENWPKLKKPRHALSHCELLHASNPPLIMT